MKFKQFVYGLVAIFGTNLNAEPIYLDYQASTPTDSRVVKAMLPFFTKKYGNPHSITHTYGIQAHQAIEQARDEVAKVINANPEEIIFTSGATEANNIAILGTCRLLKSQGKFEIISLVTEHKSVLGPLLQLEKEGFKIILLPVQKNGLLDLEKLKNVVSTKTALISIMAVNNEIGVLQPIREVGVLAHKYGALFHTDAVQAFGKVAIDVKKDEIDLLSISGHKIYGPKGIGALYIKKGVNINPIVYGGDQEKGIRPGTVPTPLCVGLGLAAKIMQNEFSSESERLLKLRNKLLNNLKRNLPDIIMVNGDLEKRIPGNLNVSFIGINRTSLVKKLNQIAVSVGSACTSAKDESSYVINAINHDNPHNFATLRISIGRFTSEGDIEKATTEIVNSVRELRENEIYEGNACQKEN